MIIVKNNIIPFKGYAAINIFGIIFIRDEVIVSEKLINHERIHTAQIKELGFLPFYIIYLMEWIIRLFCSGNAYRNISFEKEAYAHAHDLNYLHARRKPYAMWRRKRL